MWRWEELRRSVSTSCLRLSRSWVGGSHGRTLTTQNPPNMLISLECIWRLVWEAVHARGQILHFNADQQLRISLKPNPPQHLLETHTPWILMSPPPSSHSWSGRCLQVPGLRRVLPLRGERPDQGGPVSVWAGLPVGGRPALPESVCPAAGLLWRRGVSRRSWTRSPVQVWTGPSDPGLQLHQNSDTGNGTPVLLCCVKNNSGISDIIVFALRGNTEEKKLVAESEKYVQQIKSNTQKRH